ncbi:unnamed protein product [Lota lota]
MRFRMVRRNALALLFVTFVMDSFVFNTCVGYRFPGDPSGAVVQVHNRPEYLRLLIKFLWRALLSPRLLVIFSHDYFTEESIPLCRDNFSQGHPNLLPFSPSSFPTPSPVRPQGLPTRHAQRRGLRSGCLNRRTPRLLRPLP